MKQLLDLLRWHSTPDRRQRMLAVVDRMHAAVPIPDHDATTNGAGRKATNGGPAAPGNGASTGTVSGAGAGAGAGSGTGEGGGATSAAGASSTSRGVKPPPPPRRRRQQPPPPPRTSPG